MHSKVTATGFITDPDTPQAVLVVTIEIDCQECGKGMIRIPGHHLKAIRDIAIQYCDRFPALTPGTVTLVSKTDFSGRIPPDPEAN